ncbi:MAG: T9SS type A sorting domain-containing protein [Chitinophagales bacterium]
MRKIVLLVLSLFITYTGYAQCPDAGTMPSDQQLVCAENIVNLSSSNFSLGMNDVLVYAVHTSPTGTPGTILGINNTGSFNFTDLSDEASYNTEYYISAVAGPDEDGDGIPDLESDCLRVATGTPTVFLAPIVLERWADCNLIDLDYEIHFTISGGLPEYDTGSQYSVTGIIGESYTFAQAQVGASVLLGENEEFFLDVNDDLCFGSIAGVVTCSKCPAEDAAGVMPSAPRYACTGGSISATANNTNFDAARSLVYALHSGSDTSLVNVIAFNNTGEFLYDDIKEDILLNQRYYISAVVALNDNNGDPLLDISDDEICLRTAKGTPVSFVTPIDITVVENCNPETGIASLTISADGGAPAIDNTQIYSVLVGNTDFSLLSNGTLTQGSYTFEDPYTVTVTDAAGCEKEMSGSIECELVNSTPSLETPNFKLNYLAPMPVNNQVVLDFSAKTTGDVAIQLFSVSGQLVHTQGFEARLGDNKIEMSLSHLSSGMYFLQLNTIEGVIATKLMKD